MKKNFLLSIICISLVCCRKDNINKLDSLPNQHEVLTFLKDSLSTKDFASLDLDKQIWGKQESVEIKYIKIPFKKGDNLSEFVFLELNEEGKISGTRIVSLSQLVTVNDKPRSIFNGQIVISFLNRNQIVNSTVSNGYIDAFQTNDNLNRSNRSLVVPSKPEVIVSSDGGGFNFSIWLLFNALAGNGNQYGDNEYIKIPTAGGGGGGGPTQMEEPIKIDFEAPVENLAAIDVNQYLKCFESIADAGSSCSVEILADIPVDNNSNKLFDWNTGSPGHTFLQIKKTNGANMIIQNIGFYPKSSWKIALTPAPVNGKFVDNGKHEFNAGFIEYLTPSEFKTVLSQIEYLSRFIKYDIDDYNCTDFALDVFNSVRISNPLEIPKYDLPGGMAPNGTSTPQGIYNKLESMKRSGIEASKINIPGVKGWVSESKGPCN